MPAVSVSVRRQPLDHVCKAIIAALQQDGRRSYSAIAEAIGISEGAVRQRGQRLMNAGVMQIVAVTDPTELGLRTRGDDRNLLFWGHVSEAERLTLIDAIDYVVLTAGRFDIVVEVACEDDEQLLEILNNQIRSQPGVYLAESLVYLKTLKHQYNWGTR
jgi:Lrp/AsnC family transcriptional regulator for asnA, asnC and gidA